MTDTTSANTSRRYLAATDGASRDNPGPAGWGAYLLSLDGDEIIRTRELNGAVPKATNNEMELLSAIKALRFLKDRTIPVTVVSDSQYLIKGMTEWMPGWMAKGWRKADGKPVLNLELWLTLLELCEGRDVTWQWVKGHSGHPENERADALANHAIDMMLAKRRQ
jgi:ribonuclease HI